MEYRMDDFFLTIAKTRVDTNAKIMYNSISNVSIARVSPTQVYTWSNLGLSRNFK